MSFSLDNSSSLIPLDVSILPESLSFLHELKERLTLTQFRYAEETIRALQIVEANKAMLAAISNERLRNQKITALTHLVAEDGLFPGSSLDEILFSIDTRIQGFVKTYLFEKENDRVINFFKNGFIGPPCFNGRLITSEWYGFAQHGERHHLFFEHHTPFDSHAVKLENFMYCYNVAHPSEQAPLLEDLTKYFNECDKEKFQEIESLLLSDCIDAIYARACQFYVG